MDLERGVNFVSRQYRLEEVWQSAICMDDKAKAAKALRLSRIASEHAEAYLQFQPYGIFYARF